MFEGPARGRAPEKLEKLEKKLFFEKLKTN